jgi:putative endonuclease
MKTYYVYILTNKNKTVLYTGVTNDLKRRLYEHLTHKDHINSFTFKYNCYYLVYYEEHNDINLANEREKQIKGWKRFKKEDLITGFNPDWKFLNDDVFA